ncbi:MAG: hypothetical protein DSM107014_06785 [Gomphosphaeria aponina SAG 52.96 = DSM 107014]|uniref:Uncharacterized protein n=1 Tax=Gomphosphaeria aponina SAG 52.96 = DSM 107014 TaxID=1521640 RepID=A0A941GNV8_9CHRO|nr:hypothetical protein [Gomphosphaeria aponina SAG 52.96 = DSM 107014]
MNNQFLLCHIGYPAGPPRKKLDFLQKSISREKRSCGVGRVLHEINIKIDFGSIFAKGLLYSRSAIGRRQKAEGKPLLLLSFRF